MYYITSFTLSCFLILYFLQDVQDNNGDMYFLNCIGKFPDELFNQVPTGDS